MNEIRVLLADDHALVRKGFRRILEDDAQIEIVGEASNGVEAIEMAERLQPNVVVMDLAMPEQDGYVLIRELRELEVIIGRRLPTAAVSAYSREPDRRRALASWFDRHVAKPTEPVKLVETVVELWKASESVRGA